MTITRREFFVQSSACLTVAATAASAVPAAGDAALPLIIDTHQHLWDLSKFRLPWLKTAPEVLRKTYDSRAYLAATAGLNVRAIYMEVNVAADQHVLEAEHVLELCRDSAQPTIAAVIGGRPDAEDFPRYVDRFKNEALVKGVRRVLHDPDVKPGTCLEMKFVRGVQQLGECGKSFDLCMRPTELEDGWKLSRRCPETRFIVDHCGNADPNAFRPGAPRKKSEHDVESWRRAIGKLAERPNVICKISGIVARAPENWEPDDLAPIVNHCLDSFGPDRVVFGSDWPVCLLGSSLRDWIDALAAIISERPVAEQNQLWHGNAQRWYGIEA